MDTLTRPATPGAPRGARAHVDVVLPVHNEERVLETSVKRLRRFLDERFPFPATVIVADNASLDATATIADRLAATMDGVTALHLGAKGRGRALRAAWAASRAPVVAYMDVDLSTDLDALLPLVAPLLSGHSDVAIGTRLGPGSQVVRGTKRELLSRGYNLLVRGALGTAFSDAQCGFKALRKEAAEALLPQVADDGWFFDTELLVLAERQGLRIHEVPVDWVEDPDSRVDIGSTVLGDLRGLVRLTLELAAGQHQGRAKRAGQRRELRRQAGVGVASTAAYVALFTALAGPLGVWLADGVALVTTTAANAASRSLLAGRPRGPWATRAAVVLASNLALTLAALGAVVAAGGASSPLALAAAATVGTLTAGALRLLVVPTLWRAPVTEKPS